MEIGKVWRYQRGNQKIEGQTIERPQENEQERHRIVDKHYIENLLFSNTNPT